MKKIKLFVDAHVFDGIHQGTVTYIAGLYTEIIKDKRFEVYVGSEDYHRCVSLFKSNHFIHIQYKKQSNIKRLLYTIPAELRKHKIEYAHFQYITPIIKPCKYIVTIHDLLFIEHKEYFPFFFRFKNTILFYLSCINSDLITTVSEYSRLSVNKLFKIPIEKIHLTPNAVKIYTDKVESIKELEHTKFILFVSRIELRKNQTKLIRFWKELQLFNEGYKLVLVGGMGIIDNHFKNAIVDLSDEQNKNFYWLQKVSNSELFWLYKHCSLFIFPSTAEGFGIPPLEAALHGAKVLCSNKTAMHEFDFFGDFLFNPDDDDEFKCKLVQALSKPFPTNTVTEIIKNRYNWFQIKNDFAEVILQDRNNKSKKME